MKNNIKRLPTKKAAASVSALKHAQTTKPVYNEADEFYWKFNELNGNHPWMESVPEGHVPYAARCLKGGKIAYFNYTLAKEMGLIDPSHPKSMNPLLEDKLLETFALQIINEYDIEHNVKFPKQEIKPYMFMATRYLQLQHPNKKGATSGDGRGIWNGVLTHNKMTWDISSRGTGVTKLAPGVVLSGKSLQTGCTEVGYGCGQAEIDELYGSALMSEIFHLHGYHTERVLAIIDLGNGLGIGVRAAPNLFRPAHLFLYLKQENFSILKRACDYVIERQQQNGEWSISKKEPQKYKDFLYAVCHDFAKFAAHLDMDYIFAWLDWDGDNVLINGGIIDYGSVRQFGLRHDQYRYDDIERFSTNLTEQRRKARSIIQVFAQMTDYLITGKKQSIKEFRNHSILYEFDRLFAQEKLNRLLYRMGYNQNQRHNLMQNHLSLVKDFAKTFSYFEKTKTHRPTVKVNDGINRPAIFNMRNILRTLPAHLIENESNMTNIDFFNCMLSGKVTAIDAKMNHKQQIKIGEFQQLYRQLLTAATSDKNWRRNLQGIAQRSAQINRKDRLTGNAVINITEQLVQSRKKKYADADIQTLMEKIITEQGLLPETTTNPPLEKAHVEIRRGKKLYLTLLKFANDFSEDI